MTAVAVDRPQRHRNPVLAAGVRHEVRMLWRGRVLPICLVLLALLAISNVASQLGAADADYAQVRHTEAAYKANGQSFSAGLASPENVTTESDGSVVIRNIARYDYDTLSGALVDLSPSSSVVEVFKYFGFVYFPALFFLLGLWMSTAERRYGIEKMTLARTGTGMTMAARQMTLVVVAAIAIASTLLVDVIARAIASGIVADQIPVRSFIPLAAAPAQNALAQWGLMILVVLFFGGAGLALGSLIGVFAVPAIVFVAFDLAVPLLGPGDPRDWFVRLGHLAFDFGNGFELSQPVPVPVPIALGAASVGAVILLALGYVCIRIRNPLAT